MFTQPQQKGKSIAALLVELKQGIDSNNETMIDTCIKQNSSALLEKIEEFPTALHYALFKKCKMSVVRALATQLHAMDKLIEIASKADSAGNTLLHQCILSSYQSIFNFLSILLSPAMNDLARICNYNGDLPYDIIDKRKELSDSVKEAMKASLVSATLHNPVGKFSTKINESEVFAERCIKNPATQDELDFNRNIIIGCEIINEVRTVIKDVGTHPQSNELPRAEHINIVVALGELRKSFCKVASSFNDVAADFPDIITGIQKSRLGFCDECADYSLHLLMKNYPGISGVIAYVSGHLVMVIDPVITSTGQLTFGKRSVICDSWSGYAGSADDEKLRHQFFSWKYIAVTVNNKDEKCFTRNMNVVVKFNPVFHRFGFFPIDIYYSFYVAVSNGNIKRLRFLMRNYKLDVNRFSSDDCTALMYATERNYTYIMGKLLEVGAKPNLMNKSGFTVAHTAARVSSREALQVLFRHRTDFSMPDINGYSAVSHAIDQGRNAIAGYIASRVPLHKLTDRDRVLIAERQFNYPKAGDSFTFSSMTLFANTTRLPATATSPPLPSHVLIEQRNFTAVSA
ncbi:hypothetical protein AYO45_06370 [Gammaproteobacteria bacterium SCGC AG-212-F23]|nr:hypothetical protein AYO45_06370 [Gammaproteobacteria bacterium SCGC AG-212-F23]